MNPEPQTLDPKPYPPSVIVSVRSLADKATPRMSGVRRLNQRRRSQRDQVAIFSPLTCTGARRNRATCGTNQGN